MKTKLSQKHKLEKVKRVRRQKKNISNGLKYLLSISIVLLQYFFGGDGLCAKPSCDSWYQL